MAGGRIAGITVELNGDATKLTKALSDVDKSARQSQNNLKDINKLLKIDPSNTELLQQKFNNLTTAIDSTKQRLKTLNAAAEQMKLDGKVGTAEWDALQREIAETEGKLKGLTQEMENFGSVSAQKVAAAGEKIKDVSEKVGEVGSTLTKNVTLPIVGIGTAAVAAASEFDAQMSKVGALSGATAEQMQALRDKALEMGDKTKYSATEAGEAFEYMSMAGWKTDEMLVGIEPVMNLAAASGEDLARTSDIVTDALTAFGLEAKDAAGFCDILAVTSTSANTDVGMMGETFKYAAPVAGAFGYKVEDVALAIGLMANAGVKSSQAGTALRGILTSLNGEVKITGKELGEVTIQTSNADGSMRDLNDILMDCREAFSHLSESEKASTAEALVGKNAMSGFLAIMNSSDETINEFANGLQNCEGATKAMADQMNDNLAGQLTILKGQLKTLGISFGEILVPVLRDVIAMLQGVVSWLNNLSPATKEMVVRIAAVAAAVGPLLIVVSKIGGAIGTVMTWAPKIVSAFNTIKTLAGSVGGALQSLWGVILANPIAIVIAAIAALVAAFIYLWHNSEEFRQFWINLWETIKSAAETAWNAIATFLSTTWENITTGVQTAWTNIMTAITTAWDNITTSIQERLTAIGTAISTAWTTFTTTISTALSAIGSNVSSAWSNITSTVSTFMRNIKNNVTTSWNNIKSNITTTLSNIGSAITNGFNTAKTNVINALNSIKDKIKSVWDGAVSIVKGAVDKLKGLMNFHWELPKLKLPHFKISGSFSLNPPSVPKLGVEWYKKAMENGMILNSPTIFGAAGNTLLGGGEAGPEAVVGVDSLRGMINDSVAATVGALVGDITIPVYIGGTRFETAVVRSIQRYNFKSGGR